jgi:hypothetical protein
MNDKKNIDFPADKVAEFCKRNRIRKLSLFGSALRDDFRPDSDIDPQPTRARPARFSAHGTGTVSHSRRSQG